MKNYLRQTITRAQLATIFRLSDREVRREVARTAKKYPVISLSKAGGYRIATRNADYEDCKKAEQELMARIRELSKRAKQLRIFCKLVESGVTDAELKSHYNLED